MFKIRTSLNTHLAKPLKYYINTVYRKKTVPERGSIIYSDFGISGIYVGDNRIICIPENDILKNTGEVKCITTEEFIKNSDFPESIYISSNEKGAVGNSEIAEKAEKYIGEKNLFGLVFKNSHGFTKKCLDFSEKDFFDEYKDIEEGYKSETGLLKQKVKNKTGAVKWLLWENDRNNYINENVGTEKDFNISEMEKTMESYNEVPLNEEIILHMKREFSEIGDFITEVNDEKIPVHMMKILFRIREVLEQIILGYEQNENTLKGFGGDISYRELKEMGNDFKDIVEEMLRNRNIQDIIKKLGRGKKGIVEKKDRKIPKINRDEIFGIQKGSNLSRILPSELINLEDNQLKYLFYSKYLENSLLTYEIKGKEEEEKKEEEKKINSKGPIVTCIDTSGSMKGEPILKAKALIMAISKILKRENRELYILLFGSKGQLQELSVENDNEVSKIVKFLKKSYEGGTDFETPLKKALEIISKKENYNKADILMITDGVCKISHTFKKKLKEEKNRLSLKIYTVICGGDRVEKDFSDVVVVI